MYWKNNLSGRREKRFPIMVEVCLAPPEQVSAESQERTYTDNISPHGLRVLSSHPWQPGQYAEVIPEKDESPMRGEVVYCQRLENGRFCIGVRFPQRRIPWFILKRYDGL